MKLLFALSLFVFCWTVPVYAEETAADDEVMSYAEKRRQAKLSRLNDAQIFEQQMLERRAKKAKRKKTKRISGTSRSSRSSSAVVSTSSSNKNSSRRTSSKKRGTGSSGVPSLASGMFVK